MDADDRPGPRWWSTTSPSELDRLAHGVLRAARDAARELRREPPDPTRRTWTLGILAGQTKAMLGPDIPDHPPLGTTAQEGFVLTSLALALHVRAHSWAEADLGAVGVRGQDDGPHLGEQLAADAVDVLGRLMLPHASPEGWAATLGTDLARGNETLEAAVKLWKYVLHPTFLGIVDDATRVMSEALHGRSVLDLEELAQSLWAYAWGLDPETDLDAALVMERPGSLAPVDDEQVPVLKPRERAPLDDMQGEGEERQRRFQFGSTSLSLQEFEFQQKFEQGLVEIDPDTDISGPDDLRGV
ncbi:hypothetical protein [Streptomyces sp. NPDC001642]|uniref:hypothetical protein n=1 Tax=Streptomyces sp. NPDC001642 TaxID=3154392 RepID=UPI00331B3240